MTSEIIERINVKGNRAKGIPGMRGERKIPDPSKGYRPVVVDGFDNIKSFVGWAKDREDAALTAFHELLDDEFVPVDADKDFIMDMTEFQERVNMKVEDRPIHYIAAGIALKFGAFVCQFDEGCFDIEAYYDGRTPNYEDDVG